MELFPRTRRKTRTAHCLFLLALCAWGLSAQSQSARGSVDWILVLDTSASMHGSGGTANIFAKVQSAISDFIRNTHEGDTVTLYTFDRDTSLRSNIQITAEIDKKDLLKAVSDLSSNGDRTHTGKALHDALERAEGLRGRSDAAQRTVSIVLFTDGLEDVHGIANPVSIPSNVSLIPKDPPYMFFVSLGGAHEKQLESFVNDPAMENRGEVVRDAGALHIAEVMDGIRKKIEAPPKPKEGKLGIEPPELDFGQVEPGETTSSQTVSAHANLDCAVRVALGNAGNEGISIVEPSASVAVKAGQNNPIEIRLKSAAEVANGLHTITLTITPEPSAPDEVINTVNIEATLRVARVPIWRKLLKYLALLLIALTLVIVVISFIKGEPPWIWFRRFVERATLEGELQVIQPRPARVEDEFISLTQLRAKSVVLSSLVPNGATADSDAELVVAIEKRQTRVKLQRTRGAAYVNKIEVANSYIYNDDIIELGGARFIFNWINHDRPAESEEGDRM
jgi:hypothetical protein